MYSLRACALPPSCLYWQQSCGQLRYGNIQELGIQMNCGMTQFWNGAAGVMLVLRICVHLGTKQLSVQGWATICDRRKKKNQSLKESPRQN